MIDPVMAQASASPWLAPGAVLGALGAVAAAVGWMIRQDRRIEAVEQLRVDMYGDGKGKAGDLAQLRKDMQDKHSCEACHRKSDEDRRASVAGVYADLRALEARVVDGEKAAVKLEGKVDAALEALVDLKAMVAQVQSDVSAIAIQQRRPLTRQGTNPRSVNPLPPENEEDR